MTKSEDKPIEPVVPPTIVPIIIPVDPKHDTEPTWVDRTVKPSTVIKAEDS
jgi:hypothetical protein